MKRKKHVLCTRALPEPGLLLLHKHVRLEVNKRRQPFSKAELIRLLPDFDGLICLLSDRIDAQVLRAAVNLEVIANYAVGYDNIDVAMATSRGIPIVNTPDVLTETTADLAFGLVLTIARRIVEADRFLRKGKYRGWDPLLMLGSDVFGKTLGIVGFGRIGRAVARRAAGFQMRVLYHDKVRARKDVEESLGVRHVSFRALLRNSDFICIHVPLTTSTHHLFSDDEFLLMKTTAFLINAARGPVVDEKALVRALMEERIAGCGLDVHENEPAVETKLLNMPNTVLLPHIGSASIETRTKMALMVAEDVVAVLEKNQKPQHLVNPECYK